MGGGALARLFQGLGKGHDRGIALVGVFCQGCEDDLLDGKRQGGGELPQRRRWLMDMLVAEFQVACPATRVPEPCPSDSGGLLGVLAAVLAKKGQMRGAEAHRMIQQAIDPTSSDWRMETGTAMQEFSDRYLRREAE